MSWKEEQQKHMFFNPSFDKKGKENYAGSEALPTSIKEMKTPS